MDAPGPGSGGPGAPRPDATTAAAASGGATGHDAPAPEAEPPFPPQLRFLRRLVTTLTATMILGLIAIVALLAFRIALPRGPATTGIPPLPEAVQLPEGAVPAAVTFAEGFTVVVTAAGEILLYAADGTLRRRIETE